MKNETFTLLVAGAVAAVCISAAGFASCVTRGRVDGLVLEHQRQIAELEARNLQLAERLGKYDSAVNAGIERLESITVRVGRAGGKIDEIIDLFREYQRAVNKLVADYRRLQAEIDKEDNPDKYTLDHLLK